MIPWHGYRANATQVPSPEVFQLFLFLPVSRWSPWFLLQPSASQYWGGREYLELPSLRRTTNIKWVMWENNPTISLLSNEQLMEQQTSCLLSAWLNIHAEPTSTWKKGYRSCLEDHHALPSSPVHWTNLTTQLQQVTHQVPCTAERATEICSSMASHLYYHQRKTTEGFLQ